MLADELNKLWQKVRDAAAVTGVSGTNSERGGLENSRGTAAAGGGAGQRRGEGRRTAGRSPRLPTDEADTVLAGLGRLQAEMESEARSFQQRKVRLVRRLELLGRMEGGRTGWRGLDANRKERVVELEEEAESMRAAVVASHARLLGRVREVGCGRGKVSESLVPGNAEPFALPCQAVERVCGDLMIRC